MTETNDQALAQQAVENDAPAESAPEQAAGGETSAMEVEAAAAKEVPDETAPAHEASDEAAAGEEVTGETTPENEATDEAAAGEKVTDETTPENEATDEAAAGKEVADETTTAHEASDEAAAGEEIADETTPENEATDEAAAGEKVADETAPDREQAVPEPEGAAAPDAEETQTLEEQTVEEQAVEAVPLAAAALPFAAALEAKNPIEGKVIGWNKGGFHVVSDGVTTFCPRSLMELSNRPRPPSHYVNNTYGFHVLEIKEAGRRIVLTRRPAIRSERRRALDEIRARQKSREPVSGRVTSVTEFGAFVDLGEGLGGLVHRTQISRTRSGEPADLVKVGQQVEAVVTKVETKSGKRSARISLSMKALEADPWKETATGLSAGDRFKGKVVRHCEFGFFVELAPGLDGLVHTSQLPIGKSMNHPAFAAGEDVEGWIVDVAPKRRRIALSLREAPGSDPWQDLGKQYVEGAEVEGKVEQVSRFGIFVELEPGLTGLLPMSAVTLPEGNQASRAYPPGREIKVVIESIDRKRRRLGLAPSGSQLVGTKTDYRKYRQRQKQSSGLNAMASAFARLQQPR